MSLQSNFELTPNAIKRLKVLGGAKKYFRVSVLGGGCSGFQYKFGFDDVKNPNDMLIDCDGVLVVIDEISIPFLEGATLDYIEELIGSSFKIINPNAANSCGCGSSFSV